jgi:hypothetical protein
LAVCLCYNNCGYQSTHSARRWKYK